jgi:hypothetical protein
MSMCVVRCPKCKAFFVESSEEWNQDRGCCKQCAPRKYRNIKTDVGGILFDSQKEAQHYRDLLARKCAGEISDLVLQPVFPIVVNGKKIAKYIADFQYRDSSTAVVIVEDIKSSATRTSTYRLKKKLVEALYGIVIVEV